jgi:hypothetical protein
MADLPDPTGPLDPEAFRVLSEEWKAWADAYREMLNGLSGTTAGQWNALASAESITRELWGLSGWLEMDAEVRRGK